MKENYGNKNKISRFRHRYDCNTPSNQMQTQISMPHQQRPAQILSELPEQYHQQLMQLFNHFQQQSKQRIMPTQDPYQQRPVQRSPDKSFHQHLSQLKDIYQQRLMQTLSGDPIHVMEPLTDEQLAFEIEFKKWEKNFADWQKAYASHHDRVAFKQYEEKFLEVREKLLKRRFQIYSKNSVQQKLASELGAAEAMAESILQKFSDSVTPNFHERVESDRFAKRFLQQPLAPSWNDDNLRMQRSRSQYCNRDLPGSSRHQQFATSSSRKENVRERNDRWIYDRRKINQRADDRNSRSKRENITNRPQVSAKTLKKRENQLKQELESKDVKSNIPW